MDVNMWKSAFDLVEKWFNTKNVKKGTQTTIEP